MTARHDIPEAEFPDYVKQMHQDGDKKFNLEFQVSTCSTSYWKLVVGVMTHCVWGVFCAVLGQAASTSQ